MTTAIPAQTTVPHALLPDVRHLRLLDDAPRSGPEEPGTTPLIGYLVLVPEGTDPAQFFAAEVPRRRIRPVGYADTPPAPQAGGNGVRIDPARHVAEVDGRELDLTYLEFELLAHLVRHPHHVHSREQLIADIWGYDHIGDGRTVDVHVARLRRKLGSYRHRIVTIRRVGYKYVPDQQESPNPDARRRP
ncbi:winged helix-turn-helix domain-containing protein [Streptomyces sp. NPDC051976]|uniref:winged helix-turn-helix domain-containing protein n=1 Tax=Streptomyces sp. NPDC051976 TaxID=3154947 RepID=UPI00341C1F09